MVKDYRTKEVKKTDLYGFSVIINDKKEPTHEDYVKILGKMQKFVEIVDFVYENKKRDRVTPTKLHIHGIFRCSRNPYFRSVMGHGPSIRVEPIYDLAGWNRYSAKNMKDTLNGPEEPQEKIDNQIYMF